MHLRRLIVLAVVARLGQVPGVTAVKPGRAAPMPVAAAPYLLVYARTEDSRSTTLDDDDDRRLEREVIVAVEIVTASADDDDGETDALALEVEKAMAADTTLGGLVKDLELRRTTLDARAEGETRTGRARLEYLVEYHTTVTRPDQALP